MWVDLLRPLIIESGATFFEVNTALAFADFAARGAEIAVVEVGLGGRLDSTNVVRPLVSAVTKVALDHQAYLGDTLDAIATEKAGIAKPGAPFVVGEADPSVVAVLAREAGLAVRRLDPAADLDLRTVPADATYDGPLRLVGAHQRRNAAVARAVLEALPEPWRPDPTTVADAFAGTVVPGRLDRRGRWLFDVAHNPDGMRALVRSLRDLAVPGPVHALVSILGDKAWPEMLVTLDAAVDMGILTVAPSADSRRWNLGWLSEWLARPDRPPARAEWHLVPEFGRALEQVQARAGTIVVTGSFHTVGDVMQALGME
jgi:dihydrofolate synthase / folylpolyglutamate synthase